MKYDDQTPKELARAIALGALERAYHEIENDFAFGASSDRRHSKTPPPHFRIAVHQAFAKLHNSLGEKWGHDMSSGWLPEGKNEQPVD
mgnify:CR=1 FL=1